MPEETQPQRRVWFHFLDVALNIIIIVAIVAAIRTFLVSPFQVEGNSMVATLEDNEYIIINKLAYYLGDPQRGDIVVFHPPGDPRKYYVKRVIGLPGDRVILRGGFVYLQEAGVEKEVRIDESPYLDEKSDGNTFRHPPGGGDFSEEVFAMPSGHYFLLGDNRQGSLDSRSFMAKDGVPTPYVPDGAIKGKVWFVALPITKIHAFAPPEYGL